jgi:hypothetical protein
VSASRPLDLAARRALLREALATSNPHDFTLLAASLQGATEEERTQLTKTLPPSRLFNAEGTTTRAIYALAALGKPKLVAESLYKVQADYIPPALAGARERSADWMLELCDELAEVSGWQQGKPLELALALQAASGLRAQSPRYVQRIPYFLIAELERNASPEQGGAHIARGLQRHDGLLMQAFWRFFEVEGLGANHVLTEHQSDAWNAALMQLAQSQSGFREQALDASLDALLRDFSARSIIWYLQVQQLLQPTAQEVSVRQNRYLAVLCSQPGTAVGWAQELLGSTIKTHALDAGALIEASTGVLLRTEKKLLKAQLKLLTQIRASDAQRDRISQIVADALPSMPADVAEQARKLLPQISSLSASALPAATPAPTEPIEIPPPRSLPLPGSHPEQTAIQDLDELVALVAELLEGVDRGADLPRMLDYLSRHGDVKLPESLSQRAAAVMGELWDDAHGSPRRLLLAALLGQDEPGFKGYRRHVVARVGQPDLPGVEYQTSTGTSSSYDPASDSWKVTEHWSSRSGYQHLPTHAATALLSDVLQQLQQARKLGQLFSAPLPVPAHARQWSRQLCQPGEGMFARDLEVLGREPRPFWLAADAQPLPDTGASLHERALNVSQIAQEFTFRAQEAREQDGFDSVVHWAAWLLRDNLDTLAAQMHPVLCAAVQVVNVRGLAPLLTALGAARQPPLQPVYSALALAASAKMAEHRAQAAEALAQLADSNLLHPQAFAAELAAHLCDGFALAGRAAQTLEDAASISALSGYRMLQTLGALLPHLQDINGKPLTQAGKLVELAAHLSADYGLPLPIPAALAARSKGSSALAVALRTLLTTQPHETALAQQALHQSKLL